MQRYGWMKALIVIAALMLVKNYAKAVGAAPAVDDGGVGERRGGGWG